MQRSGGKQLAERQLNEAQARSIARQGLAGPIPKSCGTVAARSYRRVGLAGIAPARTACLRTPLTIERILRRVRAEYRGFSLVVPSS